MRKFAIAALIVGLFLVVPPVFADFFETFDTYPAGTVSPLTPGNPWTCSVDGNATCGSATGYAPCFANSAVFVNGGAPSPLYSFPNVYQLNVVSGVCSASGQTAFTGTHYVSLSANFNVTASGVLFKFVRIATVSTANINATVFLCGAAFTNRILSELFSTAPATYTAFTQSTSQTIGATCPVTIKVMPVHGASSTAGAYRFDNVLIKNANAIFSPADIILLDSATRLQFNMSQYPGTFMIANYSVNTTCGAGLVQASPNACILNNILSSYLNMPLVACTLLTLKLGPSTIAGVTYPPFYRSIIPTSTTHQVMLLDSANKITAYSITVNDIGQVFTVGSKIFLTQGGTTLVSGYLDSGSNFNMYVPPGQYSIKLIDKSGTHNFLQTQNLGSVTAIIVQINKFIVTTGPGGVAIESFNVGWGCSLNNSTVANYQNTLLLATKVIFTIYNTTATGTFQIAQATITGTIGTATTTFTGIKPNLGSYSVQFHVFDNMGDHFLGPLQVTGGQPACPSVFPGLLPALPSFPVSVFGMDQFNPNPNAWNGVLAIFIIILTAGVIGARNSAFGFMVLAFETMFFFLALFIPSTYILIYTFVLSGVMGFLVYRRRRTVVLSQ